MSNIYHSYIIRHLYTSVNTSVVFLTMHTNIIYIFVIYAQKTRHFYIFITILNELYLKVYFISFKIFQIISCPCIHVIGIIIANLFTHFLTIKSNLYRE